MYTHVCVAGTFDRLHRGHKALLTRAFAVGELVTVGLTTDAYIARYKVHSLITPISPISPLAPILPYPARLSALRSWLVGYADRAVIVPIDDPFEPAVSDPSVDALVVSDYTRARGQELNAKRQSRGLPPLALVVVPMMAADDGQPLSSTRVRTGYIDTAGRLTLPDHLRNHLSRPLGNVLVSEEQFRSSLEMHADDMVITVGDMTTRTILDLGRLPDFMVIDHRVNRKPYTGVAESLRDGYGIPDLMRNSMARGKQWVEIVNLASGPGHISADARAAIRSFFVIPASEPASIQDTQRTDPVFAKASAGRQVTGDTRHTLLVVSGEEDLLTLPIVEAAPVGSVVYYGQPPAPAWACGPPVEGMVEVAVTAEKKQEAAGLLGQFV